MYFTTHPIKSFTNTVEIQYGRLLPNFVRYLQFSAMPKAISGMFSHMPHTLSQTLIRFGMWDYHKFAFLSKLNELQRVLLVLLCTRFQTTRTSFPVSFLHISINVVSVSYPVLWKQGNELVSLETLEQLVDNINTAQTSWRAEVHRPFVGKTQDEMLRIRGGKRYFQASFLIGDVTINKACFLRMGGIWHQWSQKLLQFFHRWHYMVL